MNTARKAVDWSLLVRKKNLIIGDSNLSMIPAYQHSNLQIDSFPGANFEHAHKLLKKAVVHTKVEKVVLSFGINHRSQKVHQTAIKQLLQAVHAAKSTFPHAEIWIPQINFYSDLPLPQQALLDNLNRYIRTHLGHIPKLQNEKFQVKSDGIHWTTETARSMLEHWTSHLNL